MKYNAFRFDEVTINLDRQRIPLSSRERAQKQGEYRYFGAQGVIDYVDNYIFDGEFLLIAEDGENLKSHKLPVAQIVTGKFWLNNHAHILQTNDMCDIYFLCYLINSMDLSGYITGSAQPKLSQSNLNAVILHLPDVSVQKKIAQFLRTIDDKISLNQKINNNLEQQAQALFKSWFVNFEPFGGLCPDDWSEGTIEDLSSDVICGKTPSTKILENYGVDVPFITIPDMHGSVFVVKTERKLSLLGANSQSKKMIPRNSVCVSCIGTAGLVSLCAAESQTNQQINSIIPKHNVSPYYIYLLMLSKKEEINKFGQGGSTIVNLNKTQFSQLKVLLPTEKVLLEFHNIVQPMFEMILINTEENIRLETIRDSLLPKLMSGEIDVNKIKI